jgi:hypothetical protein
MNDDKESIKSCIESSEGILHKRCDQLRELIFINDDYDPVMIMNIAKDIKLTSEIIIAQASKLNRTT